MWPLRDLCRTGIGQYKLDDCRNLLHLLLSHSQGSNGRSPDSKTAGIPWTVRIKRKRISVESHATADQGSLSLPSIQTKAGDVHKHQMVVCPTGINLHTIINESLCHGLGILHNPGCIGGKLRLACLGQCDCLCSYHLWKRASDHKRATLVHGFGEFFLAQNHSTSRSSESLVSRSGDDICPCDRVVISLHHFSSDKSGKMSHIHHEHSSAFLCNLAHYAEIDQPWISTVTCKKNERLDIHGHLSYLIVVEKSGLLIHRIGIGIE